MCQPPLAPPLPEPAAAEVAPPQQAARRQPQQDLASDFSYEMVDWEAIEELAIEVSATLDARFLKMFPLPIVGSSA